MMAAISKESLKATEAGRPIVWILKVLREQRQWIVLLFLLLTALGLFSHSSNYLDTRMENRDGANHAGVAKRMKTPEWKIEMEQTIPEWQKECRFEDDFLLPLYKSSPTEQRDVKITLVSEFFDQSESAMEAVSLNMRNNLNHGRFVYIIGQKKKHLDLLKNMAPLSDINMEVWYAPGGVTYRHIYAVATRHKEPFVVHSPDIAVGDMTGLLDACPNFDDTALFGSRVDVYPDPGNPAGVNCTSFMDNGSFEAVVTNPKSFTCEILDVINFDPSFWGVDNVVASFLPKNVKANLCPHWKFSKYNTANNRSSTRINHPNNDWTGVDSNEDVLSGVCDLQKLIPFEEIRTKDTAA